MARLPQPGGDSGNWGGILNEYLEVAHNGDGTLKASAVSSVIQDGSLTAQKLAVTNTPTSGQVLSHTGTDLAWTTIPTGSTPTDATTTSKGVVQLAGDLGGSAAAPTVPGLSGKEATIAPGTNSQYYRGDKSWQTLDKTAVGLANVDNTSDASKPVSSAVQTALNAKEATLAAGTSAQYYRGDKSWQTLDKVAVGLANVDNTSDANKPVSSATQTALNSKANTAHMHAAADVTSGVFDAARLPDATDTTKGVVELATNAEAVTGTDTARATTPAGVKAAIDAAASAAQSQVIFVNQLSEIPPGTPVDTLVVVRAA